MVGIPKSRLRMLTIVGQQCLRHTVPFAGHLNMDSVRVDVFRSERAEHGRVRLCSVGVASLRRAALQCEVAVCRLYECVLAQAVEGVLEAVQRADVWITVEPTCVYNARCTISTKLPSDTKQNSLMR